MKSVSIKYCQFLLIFPFFGNFCPFFYYLSKFAHFFPKMYCQKKELKNSYKDQINVDPVMNVSGGGVHRVSRVITNRYAQNQIDA